MFFIKTKENGLTYVIRRAKLQTKKYFKIKYFASFLDKLDSILSLFSYFIFLIYFLEIMATSSQQTVELISESQLSATQVSLPNLNRLKTLFELGEERLFEISQDESIPANCKDLVTDFAHSYFVTAKQLLPSITDKRITRSQSRALVQLSSSFLSQPYLRERLSTP